MTTFEPGDRVTRLSFPDKKPLYEATIIEPVVIQDRGVRKVLYRLANEEGDPSPIKVSGKYLRKVEVET